MLKIIKMILDYICDYYIRIVKLNKENKKNPLSIGNKPCYNTDSKKENYKGGDIMYSALDVARYIILYYREKKIAISNLKLQKLLYYVQGEFLSSKNECCFCDEIQAWKHGPVIPNVYFSYNSYMANPILSTQKPSSDISDTDKTIINKVLDKYEHTDAWDLVDMTHQEYPWKSVYRDDVPNIAITIDSLKRHFRGQHER